MQIFFNRHLIYVFVILPTDRVNEYSDEDEENEFSSTEDNYDANDGITSYDAKYAVSKRDMLKYRQLDRHDTADTALGGGPNPVDSDSEFENLKDKGSRAKISRVCILFGNVYYCKRNNLFLRSVSLIFCKNIIKGVGNVIVHTNLERIRVTFKT